MRKNTTKWLDDLCAQYEEHWMRNDAGITQRIQQFLNHLALTKEQHWEAYLAIVEIDLERDWLAWRKWLKTEGESRPVREVLAKFATNARLAHCLCSARAAGVGDVELKQLFQAECRARVSWGDNPHREECQAIDGFAWNWPASRHFTSIYAGHESTSRTIPLHGLTEFGRQRSNEFVYPSTSYGLPANRIAIADREDARFSRQQFSVQILSPEFSIVTNLSQVQPITIAEGKRLLHLDSAMVSFPFQFRIVDLVLSFT